MTSLIAGPDRRLAAGTTDPRHRRPLVLIAPAGGAVAAASTLVVCLALGVVGWFLTDAGSRGEPRDGLTVGAIAWLMGHGSGVGVDGVRLAAWTTWRIGHRLGDSVSGHGPDADAIADGERDWTVPVAVTLFATGYAVVAALTASLAGGPATAPSSARAVLWSLLLAGLVGGPAVAVGSGRAAIWTQFAPASVRATLRTARSVVVAHLLVGAGALVVALVLDFGTAANVLSQLHLSTGEAVLFLLATVLVLPNAALFSSAYLLGPGFTVGSGTVVSPTLVSIGALPMFPLLAALPDDGPVPAWTVWLMGVPPLTAALAAGLAARRHPTVRWEEGALRGLTGGVLAGVALGFLTGLAGGQVGPGRMRDVAPYTFDVLVHAITAFGVGGLVGGVAMTWWHRRVARRAQSEA